MRRPSFLLLTLLLLSGQLMASADVIKEGINALTTTAIQGPSIQCEDESLRLSKAYYGKGADCTDFIESNGKLGKLGKTIVSHMNSLGAKGQFYNKNHLGMQMACPNWVNLTNEQRAFYWVWFFAAISWKESTCGAALTNKAATHGTAAGHLQLNLKAADRDWRGGDTGESCAVRDIRPADNNLRCGIEILNEQLKGKAGAYKGNGNLFGRGAHTYWQELKNKNGGLIMKLVRDFPLCKK